jgi:hypothetical protein
VSQPPPIVQLQGVAEPGLSGVLLLGFLGGPQINPSDLVFRRATMTQTRARTLRADTIDR